MDFRFTVSVKVDKAVLVRFAFLLVLLLH